MISDVKKIELLAPAKNKECAFAAINAGADAVYLGANSFGARKNAGNSIHDIAEIIEYAHKFLVKVYITVNTIFFDNELAEVEKLIWQLYEIDVDAIIFQDFSFFNMNLPPIILHASTQCNNDSLEKIKFLKEMNVQRVVLPREFSLNQIKNVISNIDIETEVFVHGALCVSYSGQCYFSNYIGGRSANRGECAQPCRKKYSLIDSDGNVLLKSKYLLSMKDNNLSNHLIELIDAGVTSLKIEGRLKDKDYVTNVVSYYRKALDNISIDLRASKGVIKTDFEPDIYKTFNRQYTNFYFDENRKEFINAATPKFCGEKIGKVLFIKGNTLKLDVDNKINVSDKITYFDKNNDLSGTTITKVSGSGVEVLDVGSITPGTILFRNYDSEFYKSLDSSVFLRKLPIDIYVDNNKIVFKSFGCNIVEYNFSSKFEIANNVDNAKKNIKKQLSKLGDTEFCSSNIDISNDFNLFIPISKINEIRRVLVSDLQNISVDNYVKLLRKIPLKTLDYPIRDLDYSFNISNKNAREFYQKCNSNVIEFSPEISGKKTGINLMKTKHCLRDYANICLKHTRFENDLYLLDEYGVKYPLEFDCKNCVMYIKSP